MMKSKFMALMGLSLSLSAFSATEDPVIMKIDGQNVYKSEFEYIYHKNNSTAAAEQKSLDEYVDLFVNYKLKVRQAKNLGMDNSYSFESEYRQYEKQLSMPYMRDSEMEQVLLKEAFERKKFLILASHILVKVDQSTDSVVALERINRAYNDLQNGANFADMAVKYSDCPSKTSGGSLGYFTAFDMVYEFENVAYETPVGSYSKPFRTQYGYHIVKVFDKKENILDRRVSHILIKREVPNYQQKADSILDLLQHGAKFEKMVQKYSMDSHSVSKNGDLGYMNGSIYPRPIAEGASSLNKVGEYKKVATPFGIHILKLTEVKTYKTIDDCLPELKDKLAKSDRSKMIDQSYTDRLKNKYDVVVYQDALDAFVPLVGEENSRVLTAAYRRLNEPLYTFNGNVYAQDAFLTVFKQETSSYMRSKVSNTVNIKNPQRIKMTPKEMVYDAFDKYLAQQIFEAEREDVINTNPELRNLLQEYSDGLLLFEISSKMVWNKASIDTAGLRKFFEEHKSDYSWKEQRYKGIVVRCKDDSTQKAAENILKTFPMDEVEAEVKQLGKNVKVVCGVFAKGQNITADEVVFHVTPQFEDKEYPLTAVRGVLIDAPQEYSDVKGAVTSDYQNYLEKEWVKNLRERYTVEINREVLKTVK